MVRLFKKHQKLNAPKVTIYIPCFNYGRYVERAIHSVLNQSYKDWELLVINDGSTDETQEVLRKYESNEKISVVHQENRGLPITCNIALRLSKGEYFMRLDGDDFLDENALHLMVDYLERQKDIGLVYPDYYLVDEEGEVISAVRRTKIDNDKDVLLDEPAHGACTMFRKSVLIEMGGYNEEITCQDGYDIWLRFIELYKPGNINLPLFFYRQHRQSLTKNVKKILTSRRKIKAAHANKKRMLMNRMDINRLAIIPVRLHSNVMNRLALNPIAGEPLLNYTIKEAIRSGVFNKIVVVSEDDEILQYVAKTYPSICNLKRSFEEARQNTSIYKTVQRVLDILNEQEDLLYEEGMILYFESPLKKAEHFEKAIDTMHIFDADSVLPLCETYSPHYIRGHNGIERIGDNNLMRLEKKQIYKGNGALLSFKIENLKQGTLLGKRVGHIMMLPEESINIYTGFDLKMVEVLLKEQKNNS